MKCGKYYAIQRSSITGLSLGIHIELLSRHTNEGIRYGPYVDFHIIQWVISFGINPIYAGDSHLHSSYSRGGLSDISN